MRTSICSISINGPECSGQSVNPGGQNDVPRSKLSFIPPNALASGRSKAGMAGGAPPVTDTINQAGMATTHGRNPFPPMAVPKATTTTTTRNAAASKKSIASS